jgi:CheY-like chemotaxis protein
VKGTHSGVPRRACHARLPGVSARPDRDHTVLVVDDDEDLRQALTDILEGEGFAVVPAENGVDALDKLRTGHDRPCVILLDLMMPKMDGATFRKVQLQDPALAAIPVVIVSANWKSAQTAQDLGVADVLSKPFSATDLIATVSRLCA